MKRLDKKTEKHYFDVKISKQEVRNLANICSAQEFIKGWKFA